MKKSGMTYRIEPVEPAAEIAIDLESWLADLLVNYWQPKGMGVTNAAPPFLEIIGRKATLGDIYKKKEF